MKNLFHNIGIKTILGIFIVLVTVVSCGVADKNGDSSFLDVFDVFDLFTKSEIKCSGILITDPVYVTRENGKPELKEFTFTKGEFDLCVAIRAVSEKSPASVAIKIDDYSIASSSDFNANFESSEKTVSNSDIGAGEHNLKVKVKGKPGTALQILIYANGENSKLKALYSREDIYVRSQKARLLSEEERELEFQISMKEYYTPTEIYEILQGSDAEVYRVVFKIFNEDSFCSSPQEITMALKNS